MACFGVKDEAAVHKKTDAPSAASVDGVDKDGDMSGAVNRGTKTAPSLSATDVSATQRRGRGKSSLNADVVSLLLFSYICNALMKFGIFGPGRVPMHYGSCCCSCWGCCYPLKNA